MVMDSDRMVQAIGNLLSNAIKFTPAGGKITITVKFIDDQLIVQVADTGLGVPIEEQEKIFQPFYRGAHGRRIVQGMGLGLSIAQDIVTAHGGEIELQSVPGAGSRFTLACAKWGDILTDSIYNPKCYLISIPKDFIPSGRFVLSLRP